MSGLQQIPAYLKCLMQRKSHQHKKRDSLRKTCFYGLTLFLGLILFATISGELRYRELLEWEEAYEEADTPVVSSGFNGTISDAPIGEGTVCHGSISFVLCNVPEEEGQVRRVTLHKYLEGEEVSSRTIYAPWYNIMYTLRNCAGGITCHPHVFGVVPPGSEIAYWIETVMTDGTVYRNFAFRLDGNAWEIEENCNMGTEIYNAQGELQGTLPRRER